MLVTKCSCLFGCALQVTILAKVACDQSVGNVKSFLFRLAVTRYEVLKERR